jgi:hypothetical protein
LGSLAAVAAWLAAEQADAAPVISTSVVNVPVTSGGLLDIDGDSTNDFQFVFSNSQVVRLQALNVANGSAKSGNPDGLGLDYSLVLANGATVDGSLTYASQTTLAANGSSFAPAALGSFSTGVKFIGADTFNHYAWVNFSFPSNIAPWTGSVAATAGWETTPNAAISVVPEPAAVTLGGIGFACCLIARRMRRSRSAAR